MSAPRTVLHVCGGLGLGGTEKAMQLLAAAMDPARYRPVVHAFADGPRRAQLTALGIPVHIGPDLLRTAARTAPDIIHLHRAGWPEPRLLRSVTLAGAAAVVETNVFGRHDPSPQAAVIDRHLFVSSFCLRRYGAVHGVDVSGPRHRVLYNPVDTAAFAACPGPTPGAPPVVGRVSRADPGKWSALALEFLPHLLAHVPGAEYRVIGGTPQAREWVAAHGLDAHVRFMEPVSGDAALAAFLGGLGVLAHANDTGETFGMVIAEAMAAGLPVVTHPCPGLKDNAQLELVEHGVTGLVAATPEDYAAAVVRLLADPALARRLGQAGRAKARTQYDTRVVAARLMDIYDELPDRSAAGATAGNAARAPRPQRAPEPNGNQHAPVGVPHPFARYTAEVARFGFAGQAPAAAPAPLAPGALRAAQGGCLRALEREPREHVLLLGLGTGDLARALDAALPPGVGLTVCELDTALARAALAEPGAPWARPGGRTVLLADTSPWAHFLLWTLYGLTPATAHLRLYPGIQGTRGGAKGAGGARGWALARRLFTQARPLDPAPAGGPAPAVPALTLAAILAPDDPGLEDFFAQVPPWVTEVVALWDAAAPPAAPPACAAPVRHLARPLGDDFAAQRNAMLDACATDWVLVLDADERLDSGGWLAARELALRGEAHGLGLFLLPRRTLHPDGARVLAGLGLWPDLQPRLLRRTPALRYRRPVHERLTGARGPFGVALDLSILHLNRLLRDPEGVRAKLAGFDRAGGSGVRHVLSADYPALAPELLPGASGPGAPRAVILPFDPA